MRRARAVGALVIIFILGACSSKDTAARAQAPRLTDGAYEAAANAICLDAVHAFDTATTLGKTPSNAQSADLLVGIAGTFAPMVARLRTLSPTPADRPAVDGWLHDWDRYVAFGRQLAAAIRTGSEGPLVRASTSTQGDIRRRLRAFAAVNRMKACVFP